MVLFGFKAEYEEPIQSGTKCRTTRQARCQNEDKPECTRKLGALAQVELNDPRPTCFLICPHYKYRAKEGDILQPYTGLMQRNYCKDPTTFCLIAGVKAGDKCNILKPFFECKHRGAKLLKTATCTASNPIRFEDLT